MTSLRTLAVTSAALTCLLASPLAHGQSSSSSSLASSETSSSSSPAEQELPTETPELLGNRALRTEDFRKLTLKFATGERQYRERRAVFIKKRAEGHADCRDQLRRSNRDTKTTIIFSCYRDELKLEQEFLDRELQYLEEVPGISKLIRRTVITQHTLLSDAIDAIIQAIDSRLYTSEAEIIDVRKTLRTKYRLEYANMLTLARIDRLLSWTDFMLEKIDLAIAEEQKEQGTVRPEWTTARNCLRIAEGQARAVVLEQEVASDSLSKLMTQLTMCQDQIITIPNIRTSATGSGSSVSSRK